MATEVYSVYAKIYSSAWREGQLGMLGSGRVAGRFFRIQTIDESPNVNGYKYCKLPQSSIHLTGYLKMYGCFHRLKRLRNTSLFIIPWFVMKLSLLSSWLWSHAPWGEDPLSSDVAIV